MRLGLFEAEASIHQEDLPGNKIGIFRRQKKDGFGDINGPSDAFEVGPIDHIFLDRLGQRCGHFG